MGIAPEVQLVVKHTFLEFIEAACSQEPRARAFTDTALIKEFDMVSSCSHSEAESEGVEQPEVAVAPAERPSVPRCELAAATRAPLLAWADQSDPEEPSVDAFRWMLAAMTPEPAMQACMGGWTFGAPDALQPCVPWMPMGLWHQGSDRSADIWPSTAQQAEVPSTPAVSSTAAPRAPRPKERTGACPTESPDHASNTTLMLRCLPEACTRDALLALLDRLGFAGHYDLVYVPVDFSSQASLRYAFVNAVSPASAQRLWACLDGFQGWGMPCEKACTVCWSDPHQGVAAHVDRYRNSPVMHATVPEAWKPALFESGVRIAFPPPTRAIKAPKASRSKRSEAV